MTTACWNSHHILFDGWSIPLLLDEVFATKTLEEWAEVFDTEPDMFWAPVNEIDDVIIDPQVHAAGAFVDVPEEGGGAMRVASPSDFYGTPWAPRAGAPKLGQHSREVLAALGRSEADIDELIASGVVAGETEYSGKPL